MTENSSFAGSIHSILLVAMVAFALPMPGCAGGGNEAFCGRKCDCEICTDIEEELCVASADYISDVSAIYGCDDKLSSATDCYVTDGTCLDRRMMLERGSCQMESDDYSACMDGTGISIGLYLPTFVSGGGTAECEEFEALYEDCYETTLDFSCYAYDEAAAAGGADCTNYWQVSLDTFECDTFSGTGTWDWGTCDY